MPKCKVKNCKNFTQYKDTKQIYCIVHLARVRRHGYPELKKDAYESLEKLPHQVVDNFIMRNCGEMEDIEIAKKLREKGYKDATVWTIGYRRRKLGNRKYLRGEIQKHKAWIRAQAIKKYGNQCELCGYKMAVDTHHVIPKYKGGPHEIDNLMVVCPNCHSLITRRYIVLKSRNDIPIMRRKMKQSIKSFYS